MSQARGFLLGAAKIATAIVISVVAISLIFWTFNSYQEKKEESELEQLSVAKFWPADEIFNGEITANVTTKYRESGVQIRFEIIGMSDSLNRAFERNNGTDQFTLVFGDADGFTVFSHVFPISQGVRIMGAPGKITGVQFSGIASAAAADYQSASSYEIQWNFLDPSQFRPAPERGVNSGSRELTPAERRVLGE